MTSVQGVSDVTGEISAAAEQRSGITNLDQMTPQNAALVVGAFQLGSLQLGSLQPRTDRHAASLAPVLFASSPGHRNQRPAAALHKPA